MVKFLSVYLPMSIIKETIIKGMIKHSRIFMDCNMKMLHVIYTQLPTPSCIGKEWLDLKTLNKDWLFS